MDIGKLKNNYQYDGEFDNWTDVQVHFTIKEDTEFNIHVWEGYFESIFDNPLPVEESWYGFTRDVHELKGAYSIDSIEGVNLTDIDEYLRDILQYSHMEFECEEHREVYRLIVDFLSYAKNKGYTVFMSIF